MKYWIITLRVLGGTIRERHTPMTAKVFFTHLMDLFQEIDAINAPCIRYGFGFKNIEIVSLEQVAGRYVYGLDEMLDDQLYEYAALLDVTGDQQSDDDLIDDVDLMDDLMDTLPSHKAYLRDITDAKTMVTWIHRKDHHHAGDRDRR